MADLERTLRDTTSELNATCADILKIPPDASAEIRCAFANKYLRLTGERARLQAEVNGL
jgi:hypothetical protein